MSNRNEDVATIGGCLCGAVRYEAEGPTLLVELCHCRSCRRATGAPVMAWAAFRREAFAVTAGDPAAYASSPGLARSFCGRCGTSLTLSDERFPAEIYVSLASLDDAEAVIPEFHIWRAHRLAWLETADHLPRFVQFKSDGILES